METDGVEEHSMQSLNTVSVTNMPPINSRLIMEEKTNKEGVNEAYQNCRSPTNSGNIKHANKSESKDTYVNEINLKVNEPHVLPTSTTRASNNPNTHSHEN